MVPNWQSSLSLIVTNDALIVVYKRLHRILPPLLEFLHFLEETHFTSVMKHEAFWKHLSLDIEPVFTYVVYT